MLKLVWAFFKRCQWSTRSSLHGWHIFEAFLFPEMRLRSRAMKRCVPPFFCCFSCYTVGLKPHNQHPFLLFLVCSRLFLICPLCTIIIGRLAHEFLGFLTWSQNKPC